MLTKEAHHKIIPRIDSISIKVQKQPSKYIVSGYITCDEITKKTKIFYLQVQGMDVIRKGLKIAIFLFLKILVIGFCLTSCL